MKALNISSNPILTLFSLYSDTMATIHYIQKGNRIEDTQLKEKAGIIGYSMLEKAALDIPVSPGFILELSVLQSSEQKAIRIALDKGIQFLEKQTGRQFGDTGSPLLLSVCLSPSLIMEKNPVINYLGLNQPIVESLQSAFGSDPAYRPYMGFMEEYALYSQEIPEADIRAITQSETANDAKTVSEQLLARLLKDFPQNPYAQLESAVYGLSKRYFSDPMNQDIPAAIVVQYLPHGDAGARMLRGSYTTRDIRTGEPQLKGGFCKCDFLSPSEEEVDINQLDPTLLDEFDHIAGTLEGFYLDVRQVDFMVERSRIYVTGVSEVSRKSMATKLRILSELQADNQISNEEYVNSITPKELNSLLFSTINLQSVEKHAVLRGGIAGSLGATSGRVFFSTSRLMDAYWKAKAEDGDTQLILLKKSTYAEDVQAVEIGCGVISSEGGYTSHAPIVARSLGKPAVVYPDINYYDGYVEIGGHRLNEGDYVSMEIASAEEPALYLGKAELEYPDIEKSGVKDLLEKAKEFAMGIKILANADTPEETRQARRMGADGIGLCRTEHMFHRENRVYQFRDLLITKDPDHKKELFKSIKAFLIKDFEELFEVMGGKPITIRLLDAPLHEFLPRDDAELEETIRQLPHLVAHQSKEQLKQSFLQLEETNPMLGHRGCRVGISSPEIYDVMTSAILEAAYQVKTTKEVEVFPEIMIPLIMSKEEMYLLKNGQIMEGKESVKGIIGVIREFMKEKGLQRQPFEVKIGAMIELPAAALSAAEISKQAEFFSFGTNDLTQTTMGLSRDDINSFLPAYTEMDVWKSDPFQNLLDPVKMLIDQAIQSGRQVRPDLKVGICGEHGANPEVIKYCLEIGMNYISCSPFGIPVAILAVAQSNLARSKG